MLSHPRPSTPVRGHPLTPPKVASSSLKKAIQAAKKFTAGRSTNSRSASLADCQEPRGVDTPASPCIPISGVSSSTEIAGGSSPMLSPPSHEAQMIGMNSSVFGGANSIREASSASAPFCSPFGGTGNGQLLPILPEGLGMPSKSSGKSLAGSVASNASTVFRRLKAKRQEQLSIGKSKRSPKTKSRSPPKSRRVKKAAQLYEAKLAAMKAAEAPLREDSKVAKRKRRVAQIVDGRLLIVDDDKENLDIPSTEAVKESRPVGQLSPTVLQPFNRASSSVHSTPPPFAAFTGSHLQVPSWKGEGSAPSPSRTASSSSSVVDSMKRYCRAVKSTVSPVPSPAEEMNSSVSASASSASKTSERTKDSILSLESASFLPIPIIQAPYDIDEEWVILPQGAELKGPSKRQRLKGFVGKALAKVTPPKILITDGQIRKEIGKVTVPLQPKYRLQKPGAAKAFKNDKRAAPGSAARQKSPVMTVDTLTAIDEVVRDLEAKPRHSRSPLPTAWLCAEH